MANTNMNINNQDITEVNLPGEEEQQEETNMQDVANKEQDANKVGKFHVVGRRVACCTW